MVRVCKTCKGGFVQIGPVHISNPGMAEVDETWFEWKSIVDEFKAPKQFIRELRAFEAFVDNIKDIHKPKNLFELSEKLLEWIKVRPSNDMLKNGLLKSTPYKEVPKLDVFTLNPRITDMKVALEKRKANYIVLTTIYICMARVKRIPSQLFNVTKYRDYPERLKIGVNDFCALCKIDDKEIAVDCTSSIGGHNTSLVGSIKTNEDMISILRNSE